jgi:hypothetical protein
MKEGLGPLQTRSILHIECLLVKFPQCYHIMLIMNSLWVHGEPLCLRIRPAWPPRPHGATSAASKTNRRAQASDWMLELRATHNREPLEDEIALQ